MVRDPPDLRLDRKSDSRSEAGHYRWILLAWIQRSIYPPTEANPFVVGTLSLKGFGGLRVRPEGDVRARVFWVERDAQRKRALNVLTVSGASHSLGP